MNTSKHHIKQVIVIRKDLNMRRGKEIAQGSHASSMWMQDKLINNIGLNIDEQYWINNGHTKICVTVKSEEELLEIYNNAKDKGLTAFTILDSGRTEFNNIPTLTCLAIGPNKSEDIDLITGGLKLY